MWLKRLHGFEHYLLGIILQLNSHVIDLMRIIWIILQYKIILLFHNFIQK